MALVFAPLFMCAALFAEPPRKAKWEDLPSLLTRKNTVVVVLHDSTRLAGRDPIVNAQSLTVSDRGRPVRVPKDSINEVIVVEHKRAAGWIGAIVGAVGGFFAVGALFDKPGHIPIWEASAGGAGFGAAGYFVGRRLGRSQTRIRLSP